MLHGSLLEMLCGGKGFDTSGNLRVCNEFHGHLHLNMLRMLRSPETSWWLKAAGGRGEALATCLQKAWSHLSSRPKADQNWGSLHRMDLPHLLSGLGVTTLLDEPSMNVGGDTNTINNTSNTAVDDFTANSSAVSMRCVFDLSDLAGGSQMVMPLGQSAVPGSAHYGDRTEDWQRGEQHFIIEDPTEAMRSARYKGTFARPGSAAGASRTCGRFC